MGGGRGETTKWDTWEDSQRERHTTQALKDAHKALAVATDTRGRSRRQWAVHEERRKANL